MQRLFITIPTSTILVDGVAYITTEPTRTDTDGNTTPARNGGCDPVYQYCDSGGDPCAPDVGQVLINEILPAPSGGAPEWIELYNTTAGTLNIGNCIIDDLADGGGSPYTIPEGTTIPAGGFWTADFSSYFNNAGDDARFLKNDGTTVLDAYSYGSTSYDESWYRSPDGGDWAATATSNPTRGASNN